MWDFYANKFTSGGGVKGSFSHFSRSVFGKRVQSERDDKVGKPPIVLCDVLQPAQKQHCGQRSPYLYLHRIARRADETLDLQQLLDVPDKNKGN